MNSGSKTFEINGFYGRKNDWNEIKSMQLYNVRQNERTHSLALVVVRWWKLFSFLFFFTFTHKLPMHGHPVTALNKNEAMGFSVEKVQASPQRKKLIKMYSLQHLYSHKYIQFLSFVPKYVGNCKYTMILEVNFFPLTN